MNYSRFLALATLSLILASAPAKAQEYRIVDFDRTTSTSVNPLWSGSYDKPICEIVIGYVNKSWRCTYPNTTQREDFFGDPDDKFMHGFQMGGLFTPSFDWGLGLRTGLFFESYISRSKWITPYCNRFVEVDLYIPAHASFRIPFDEEGAFSFFGGMGFQWAMSGKYVNRVGTAWTWWRRPVPIEVSKKHEYGNGGPQKVNWQAECGLNFRYKWFTLNFTYSFGIVDHGIQNTFDEGVTYVTSTKSRQDKMQASIGFAF